MAEKSALEEILEIVTKRDPPGYTIYIGDKGSEVIYPCRKKGEKEVTTGNTPCLNLFWLVVTLHILREKDPSQTVSVKYGDTYNGKNQIPGDLLNTYKPYLIKQFTDKGVTYVSGSNNVNEFIHEVATFKNRRMQTKVVESAIRKTAIDVWKKNIPTIEEDHLQVITDRKMEAEGAAREAEEAELEAMMSTIKKEKADALKVGEARAAAKAAVIEVEDKIGIKSIFKIYFKESDDYIVFYKGGDGRILAIGGVYPSKELMDMDTKEVLLDTKKDLCEYVKGKSIKVFDGITDKPVSGNLCNLSPTSTSPDTPPVTPPGTPGSNEHKWDWSDNTPEYFKQLMINISEEGSRGINCMEDYLVFSYVKKRLYECKVDIQSVIKQNYEKIERNIKLFNKGFFDYIDLDIEKAKLKEIGENNMKQLRGSAEQFGITETETKTIDELIKLIMEKYKEDYIINKPLNHCINEFNNFIQNYYKALNNTVSDGSFNDFLLERFGALNQASLVKIAENMNMPNNDSVDDDARKQFINESCIKALELFLKYSYNGYERCDILYSLFNTSRPKYSEDDLIEKTKRHLAQMCRVETAIVENDVNDAAAVMGLHEKKQALINLLVGVEEVGIDKYFEKYNEIQKFAESKIDDSLGAETGPEYDEKDIPVNDVIKIEIEKFKTVYNELLSENEDDKRRITEHERLKTEYEEFIDRLGDDFEVDLESRSLKVKNPEDLSKETKEAKEILERQFDDKSRQINEIKTKLPELFMKIVEELSREITQIEHTIGEKGKLKNDDKQLKRHIISNLTELEKSKLEAARDGNRDLLKQFMDYKKKVTSNELRGI